ncbi:Chitin synthase regulatory factor 3 [Penicillium hispanicum]|uniref:Chitin synthase regulatory factor 3 n=1 Tax=Penicillium hispanicum TaxID=1080232 RepID=UPI0025419E94|nr:Chitin synthase regulatory factor 3 [Penicillium hispanicum]KAJ5595448.1 Chitin synthase regulatory factor 3 [Penicillium hispanicum]
MAYPQRPAQRPPPLRQYNTSSPASSAPAPGPYAQDAMYAPDAGYGAPDAGYPDHGYDDPTYNYQPGPPGPTPRSASSQSQSRSMRPPRPPGGGRPPPGVDPRRGYPGDRPPQGKPSRPPDQDQAMASTIRSLSWALPGTLETPETGVALHED